VSRVSHAIVVCFLALTPVVIFIADHAAPNEGATRDRHSEDFSVKPPPPQPSDPHSSLLLTLKVTGDPCYVFLQPKKSSHYFGPLVEGEKVKWLDTQGEWVQVWIPRLRTSGWVHDSKMSETAEPISDPVSVPQNLLSTLTVLTARANVRAAPTTRAPILTTAQKDQQFWLLHERGDWYQIWLSGLENKGWIHKTLVTRNQKK